MSERWRDGDRGCSINHEFCPVTTPNDRQLNMHAQCTKSDSVFKPTSLLRVTDITRETNDAQGPYHTRRISSTEPL